MTKTTIKNDPLGFVPQSRFENLRIWISDLFRFSCFVLRIYFRAPNSIIKLTSLTIIIIPAILSAPMH
jgi:hypothetical protein